MEGVTRRTCLTMGGVPVFAGLAAYALGVRAPWRDDERPRFQAPVSPRAQLQQRHLPNVPLVAHDGERVRFYDDLVKDKKVVVTFVSGLAPRDSAKVTHNLAAVQRFFGRRVGSDIFLYSIARNPEHDTRSALARWAARSGAGRGWRFLTGRPADVETLRRGLGLASDDPTEDADPAYSIGLLRHGVEREMRWAHCQAQAEAGVIVHSLLLDFGPAPALAGGITWDLTGQGASGSAPVWNCELLLAGVQ